MNVYHIWFDLKAGVKDTDLTDALERYLGHLEAEGRLASYRITRRKLGFGHPNLPEWNVTIDFADLAQMDQAFATVAARADPVEGLHHAVNSKVEGIFFALYRDFPDQGRVRGQEKF